ncbi:hypothetical protein [Streptomyces echinatus]|uniref:hypothetical protein n=1 Tax=Streptomyces echinatus TaxID=67293 RepID=UPI00381C0A6A
MKPVIPVRVLLVAVAVLSALLVAVVAGVLSYANGNRVPGAVLYGGGAFVAWMTLSLMVMGALGWLDSGGADGSSPSRQNVSS